MELETTKVKAIITGATGMVGEGVLHECLQNPQVTEVLVINRKPDGITHPKLTEIIHQDFMDLSGIKDQLAGYNACFFCLGVSSVGMTQEEYYRLTHTLTLNLAETVSSVNKDMTFCYVSGAGTDGSEQGRAMWARVKGKTENDLMKLPFMRVFAFRPGFIKSIKGLRHTGKYYKYVDWLYPFLRTVFPDTACTLQEIGLAMIHSVTRGYIKPVLEVRDIAVLAKDN
ncbi:NAD-dependent epimerase/dehydratase family protein [Mucilaginibacter sp. UR6-11]|uniref:NAD-dependent epimerase/dehydratase family protein n=1 Tax=Mucilaginibacter sp. UR6-11 TaxID=1435644 RepID=UPI001E46B7CB|nr:NAD-dependent epimerase/dehydratase family protein [Mucilaginibacter sp. UR6-11]MCC8424058.1 NAD-dependent epimerase/dehydratase family protein [Mucilaginibacter sp. UR6-11]